MKRVLITGASGFVGRHCIESLVRRGYEVHAVTSRPPPPSRTARWRRLDLFDARSVRACLEAVRPDALLHAAWCASPGTFWTSEENYHWVQASIGLFRAFHEVGGRRLVATGSVAEYDWTHEHLVERRTPLSPATPYGLCKRVTGEVLESFARTTGISAAWCRLFLMYGPHEHRDRLVPSVITSLLRGEPAWCTSGEQVRDLLHVSDAADALAAILASDVQGPINVASGEPLALKDVVQEIAGQLGGADLIKLGALPSRPEPPVLTADVDRLRRQVGWQPRLSLSSGIAQTIHWWRDAQHTRDEGIL